MKNSQITISLLTVFVLLFAEIASGAWVVRDEDRVYIEDRKGVRWDVTEAQSLGFIPHRFQYGIGKDAFTPLQDKDLDDEHPSSFDNPRVIGIASDNEAHAYMVNRLKHHEIANTTLGDEPIVAGY